jgi:hypothetical protein
VCVCVCVSVCLRIGAEADGPLCGVPRAMSRWTTAASFRQYSLMILHINAKQSQLLTSSLIKPSQFSFQQFTQFWT